MRSTIEKQKQPAKEHPELSMGSGGFWRLSWKRAIVWSVLIFTVVNAGLWKLEKQKQSKDVWKGSGSIDLAVNAFNALPRNPTVVLLGSSLVMFPFWSLDKSYDPINTPDMFHHHSSTVFQDTIRKTPGFSDPRVFSFAIFGQMVSDSFIYVNEFLRKDKAPEFLVYGLAPRDFSDHDLPSPMATNTFKRLVNIENLAPYANLYLPGFQEKADFMMSRLCYLYDHRSRLQQEFGKVVVQAYILTGAQKPIPKVDFSKSPGFMLFGGMQERWRTSEKEYARRYKDIGERDLNVQMGFLKQLLEVARERGIKVVLVNMPLTDTNRNLLPPGFYGRFRGEIAKIANQPGVKFVDIGDNPEFTNWDFWDTAHLGPEGGRKVIKHVIPAMRELL